MKDNYFMASDDEEDFLDKVYFYLTEKRYADGTSENCKKVLSINLSYVMHVAIYIAIGIRTILMCTRVQLCFELH